ncbi:MAG: aminotransferase class III-fold pyridoxal phosphate-dependent enzyme [Victivallaceae bacterium]|jgi:glutamate-1-semialdehyde 2,1-aminomutase
MAERVRKSWEKYKRSLQYLGNGSSTSSKIARFEDAEPAVIVRGRGCRIWDADDNEYIDYRNGLGPVTLGYCVPEINAAIKEQLERGIIFGHPHILEGEAAEAIVAVIPCAEKVKFLKTGGEAIAACIKIARNATGRNKILQCGYNGWLNALSVGGFRPAGIASSQPLKGVPEALSCLHSSLPWGANEAWEEAFANDGANIAAVVIASSYQDMEKGAEFLPFIRNLTQKYGSLMIMDEIVTGFRLALGGAHEYFNVDPDLAVFAKGCANGMPISVYAGKAALIDSAKEICISSTYGGETLSLAAMKATIAFYKENNVIAHLWHTGAMLWEGVNDLFKKYNISAKVKGFPVCPLFIFEDNTGKLADAFFRNCYLNGVSLYNVSYVNFSHKEKDVIETLARIEKVLKTISAV